MSILPVQIIAAVVALLQATAAQHHDYLRLQSAAMTRWPSLHFHATVKHSSKMVHGQSKFTIVANPVVTVHGTTSVLYDWIATFTENSTIFQYTHVNGISYTSNLYANGSSVSPSVICSGSDNLPYVNSLVTGLSDAEPVSSFSMTGDDAYQCSSKDKFKVLIGGIAFQLCYLGSAGFTLVNSDMNIKVNYMRRKEEIYAPAISTNSSAKCLVVDLPSLVTSRGKSMLTGQPIFDGNTRVLKAALDVKSLEYRSCSCKSARRPCIFIHGLGIKREMAENQDTFPTIYWGNMTDHAPCCTSIKYAVLNTVNFSWTDDNQQQKVCDRALAVSDTSSNFNISDTIIITHSMGALMLSGAIANGKCSLAPSSAWISTGAPMRGSMGSKYLQDSCNSKTNLLMEKYAKNTGKCPVSVATRSLAYENSNYASAELTQAYKKAQEVYRNHVYAAMCSNKHSGLISRYQWQFWVLGSVFPHQSPQNDGMVEFHSCAGGIPESKFGNSYRDRFYVTKLNHIDVAFLSGNALFDEAKMPVKWLECLL